MSILVEPRWEGQDGGVEMWEVPVCSSVTYLGLCSIEIVLKPLCLVLRSSCCTKAMNLETQAVSIWIECKSQASTWSRQMDTRVSEEGCDGSCIPTLALFSKWFCAVWLPSLTGVLESHFPCFLAGAYTSASDSDISLWDWSNMWVCVGYWNNVNYIITLCVLVWRTNPGFIKGAHCSSFNGEKLQMFKNLIYENRSMFSLATDLYQKQ